MDWVPVAGLLQAASDELEVGQLLHTSVFSLFEAMSAVEIGNPKMDAGEYHTSLRGQMIVSISSTGSSSSTRHHQLQQQVCILLKPLADARPIFNHAVNQNCSWPSNPQSQPASGATVTPYP